MLGKVDFYLLASPVANGSARLACRVIEKAWSSGHSIALCVNDADQAMAMDDLLWTYSQSTFIPHSLVHLNTQDPVLIFTDLPDLSQAKETIVVSMRTEVLPPSFLSHRIADIIGDSDVERSAARQRYKHYRDHGIEPGTHKI
ncbi:MAG: DNA polymerase-3 subunit chi [Parasphingorhabdus sp.]|jgi:DNA polymerase-3 subunit chi